MYSALYIFPSRWYFCCADPQILMNFLFPLVWNIFVKFRLCWRVFREQLCRVAFLHPPLYAFWGLNLDHQLCPVGVLTRGVILAASSLKYFQFLLRPFLDFKSMLRCQGFEGCRLTGSDWSVLLQFARISLLSENILVLLHLVLGGCSERELSWWMCHASFGRKRIFILLDVVTPSCHFGPAVWRCC